MNRKTIYTLILALSIIALAACSTAAPTAATSSSSTTSGMTSTAVVSNTDANVTSTTASNSTDTSSSNGASTLACNNGSQSASLTVEETEGPYFTANSPERASLWEDGMPGTKLVITGYVYDANCQPVANALLDFWQANANGEYDNAGYTLRGHQYTDANGYYTLTTIMPGIYTGRTEHIHVKVQAPNAKLITTQLFFPGVEQNDSDGIFDQSLLLAMQTTSDGESGQFNFVVPTN